MTAPAVVGYTDSAPCPRVEITIPAVTGAVTASVTRSWDGQTAIVRGGNGMTVAGPALLVDYDVPFGIPVTYSYTTTNGSGAVSDPSDQSETVLLDMATAWINDPLNPGNGTAVALSRDDSGAAGFVAGVSVVLNGDGTATFTAENAADLVVVQNIAELASGFGDALPVLRLGSLTGWVRSAAGSSVSRIIGSPLPIAQAAPPQAPSKVPLQMRTNTDQATNALNSLLASCPLLCLRLPLRVPLLDRLMYVLASDVTPDIYPDLTTIVWNLTVDQVRGPSVNVLISPRSLADLGAESDTVGNLGALYTGETLLDMGRGQ